MAISLLHKKQYFSMLIAHLILKAHELGFDIVVGEVKRGRQQADYNASVGIGTVNSLHIDGLAVDVMLYKNDVYLTCSDDYLALGEWWESQSQLPDIKCCWGGRFKNLKDGGHFSVEHEGRK